MDTNPSLTNEKIGKRFENQFDLVNYAIRVAADLVISGRAPRVDLKSENPALLALEEISEGKDKFEEPNKKATTHIHVENFIVEETTEVITR